MILLFDGFHSISKCNVDVFGNVVLATQLDLNGDPGTSITNAAETVAKTACDKFNIPYEELTWIEHYKGDYYKVVTFDLHEDGFKNPSWRAVTLEEVAELIKPNLPGFDLDNFIVNDKKKLDEEYQDRMKLLVSLCPHTHSVVSKADNMNHCFACDKILE